jgi:hypothetical protein
MGTKKCQKSVDKRHPNFSKQRNRKMIRQIFVLCKRIPQPGRFCGYTEFREKSAVFVFQLKYGAT